MHWEDVFKTLKQIGFDGDLVIESFIALPPEVASALCVWRPVAKCADGVLTHGVPYLKSMARVHGLIE